LYHDQPQWHYCHRATKKQLGHGQLLQHQIKAHPQIISLNTAETLPKTEDLAALDSRKKAGMKRGADSSRAN
jgi:hypothetical protein